MLPVPPPKNNPQIPNLLANALVSSWDRGQVSQSSICTHQLLVMPSYLYFLNLKYIPMTPPHTSWPSNKLLHSKQHQVSDYHSRPGKALNSCFCQQLLTVTTRHTGCIVCAYFQSFTTLPTPSRCSRHYLLVPASFPSQIPSCSSLHSKSGSKGVVYWRSTTICQVY